MSTTDDVKPQLTPEGKFALLLILCEFAVFALFLVFDKPKIGLGACISVAVLMIAMRATWRLHEHRWFWTAIAISIVIQVPFILYIPWSNHAFRGTALLPFGFLNFIVVYGCIKLVEMMMMRSA
jgi:hypothetical protein